MQTKSKFKKSIMKKVLRNQNLWNRDFSLLTIGQIISIFGNMVLSFALPLYILDISGSASLFGLTLSLPFISLVVTSPIGGILADRLKKQRIMFWLDLATTLIIVLYMAVSGLFTAIVPVVIVKLMALNAIQGMYMPAVQSSVPLLVPTAKLVPANAVVGLINTISSMAGMAIAGIVYATFGLFPILLVSAVCFAITAIMDLLIRVPYKKPDNSGSVFQIVKSDMSDATKFLLKEKPILSKQAVVVFFAQLSLMSMIMVGLPVLITQHLGFGMNYVGISQSIMMFGGIFGGILAGTLGTRLSIEKVPLIIIVCSLTVMPVGLVFLFEIPAFTAYIIITAVCVLTFCASQMASILFMANIQEKTPVELIGKVMSFILIAPFVASASGQFIYGVFFEQFKHLPWVVVFIAVAVSSMVALRSRKYFIQQSKK